jgi:hypothetical protein
MATRSIRSDADFTGHRLRSCASRAAAHVTVLEVDDLTDRAATAGTNASFRVT